MTDDIIDNTASVQSPQPTSSLSSLSLATADAPLPVLPVSAVSLDRQSSVDHSYHHASKRKRLDSVSDAESVAAAKYLERRRKNNAASKRSRETRKQQLMGMEEEVVYLEEKNARLKQHVVELERLTQTMRAAVVDAMRQASTQ